MEARRLRDDVLGSIPGSTCVFVTLPYAPMCTRLQGVGRNRAEDKTELLTQFNLSIKGINSEKKQLVDPERIPSFHTWGIKGTTKANPTMPKILRASMPRHREQDWREKKMSRKLHLSDTVRLRMGKSVVRYFMGRYNMIPNRENRWKSDKDRVNQGKKI